MKIYVLHFTEIFHIKRKTVIICLCLLFTKICQLQVVCNVKNTLPKNSKLNVLYEII